METEVIEICPKCGSTEYIEDYPEHGMNTCTNCSQETKELKLTTKAVNEGVPTHCPRCGENMKDEDLLFNKIYDDFDYNAIVVMKCKKCESLSGYRIFDNFGYDYDFYDDNSYDSLSVKIVEQEGRNVYSASAVKRYQKKLRKIEKSPIGKCQKQFRELIKDKSNKMKEAGIDPLTITIIRLEVQDFLKEKGPFTEKQLCSILAAAISLIQDTEHIFFKKIVKSNVSDYRLEEIFNTSRMTIRKWRKILQEYSLFTIRNS